MKYLESFNESHARKRLDRDRIIPVRVGWKIKDHLEILCPRFNSRNRDLMDRISIDSGGRVDVEGDILLYPSVEKLPIKFGKVTGNFTITSDPDSPKLTSLEGCPYECVDFIIDGLKISNLEGSPKIVRNFSAGMCQSLTSLEGGPKFVSGSFDITCSKVTSLIGGPEEVSHYYCSQTPITDLKGLPDQLEELHANNCSRLTSLEGIPKVVNKIIIGDHYIDSLWDPRPLKDCNFNDLKLICRSNNPILELIEVFNPHNLFHRVLPENLLFPILKDFKDSLDYNYVRGTKENPQINLFRFKEALSEIGLKGRISDLTRWSFVDDRGAVVNFDGNPI